MTTRLSAPCLKILKIRIGSFWSRHSAYSELHFSAKLWPEFDEAALDEALSFFATRERRFGLTSAQLAARGGADEQADAAIENDAVKVA